MSLAFSVARVERAPPPAAFDLAVDLDLDLDLGFRGGDEILSVALVDERGHVGGEETLEFDGRHI